MNAKSALLNQSASTIFFLKILSILKKYILNEKKKCLLTFHNDYLYNNLKNLINLFYQNLIHFIMWIRK